MQFNGDYFKHSNETDFERSVCYSEAQNIFMKIGGTNIRLIFKTYLLKVYVL